MNFRSIILITAIFTFLALTGCQKAEPKTAASAEAKRYELTGKVISVDKQARKAKIEHEEIKGYMPAMTMNFPIKQEWVLRELKPGHRIGGVMIVEPNGDYFLDEVAISAALRDQETVEETTTEAPTDKIGKEIPDFKLTNQDGRRISMKNFRGKNLVITFIFTRCPDKDFCTLMSLNMSDLERIIRRSPDLAENTKLLSISFDPQYDTPEILRKYGAAYFGKDVPPNFDIWQLATGSEQEVKVTANYFGLNTVKEGERIAHNLRTAIIAPDGKVVKIYSGNQWKPELIMQDLQGLAANKVNS